MTRQLHLITTITLLTVSAHASTNIYDFENLTAGALDGQDNWNTTLYNTTGDVVVTTDASGNSTQALQFTQSGPDVGVDGSRLNDENFSFLDFGNTNSATIDFSFLTPYWGGKFGLGFDFDNDGVIEDNGDELAFILYSRKQDDSLRFYDHSGTATSTALSDVTVGGGWINFRLEIDFTANSGAGSVSVFYQDPDTPEAPYTSIAGLQDINLNLDSLATDAANPDNWNGMFFHFEGSTGGLDNVSAIPEPGAPTLLVAGFSSFCLLLRRRRRS